MKAVPISLLFVRQALERGQSNQPDQWVPDQLTGLTFGTLTALKRRHCGKGENYADFSPTRDKIHIFLTNEPTAKDKVVIAVPHVPLKDMSWLRLEYRDHDYLVRFHRSADCRLDRSSFSGAVFVVDPNIVALENRDHNGRWVAGCWVLVKDPRRSTEINLGPLKFLHGFSMRSMTALSQSVSPKKRTTID